MPSCCGACHIGLKAHKRRFEGNSSRGKRGEGEEKERQRTACCRVVVLTSLGVGGCRLSLRIDGD